TAVTRGEPIFKLDSSKQEAAVETAPRGIMEIDAGLAVGKADGLKADGQLRDAKGTPQQALGELGNKNELHKRNSGIVPVRDIEKVEVRVDAPQGTVAAATASHEAAQLRVSTVLPAERASAEAALAQAQVDLDKTIVRAGVTGQVEQFFLRVG